MTEPITTAELLARNTGRHPDRLFATFPGGSLSCQETERGARRVAAGLASLGVEAGDYVASWLPNGRDALLSLLGTNLAGATQVPLNIAYRGSLLEHALNLSGAAVLILHRDLLDRLEGLDLPALRILVVVGGEEEGAPAKRRFEVVAWRLVESTEPIDLADRARQPWDDMVVIFTSGTTGPSKGVRCSYLHHRAYADWFRVGDLGPEDRALVSLPMFHVAGTGWTYAALQWDASVALLPRFSTTGFWDDVRGLGATTATVVGAMAAFLLERPETAEDRDNPLRIALMSPYFPAWKQFSERFGVELWSGFGMTEVPGPLRSAFPTDNLRTAGRPTSGAWEVRLVDEHDMEVPVGTPGEMMIRHKVPWTVTHGYLRMPEATGEAWRNGWFHTGDVLVADQAGDLYFVDRVKDALRRRGENISSTEVEAEIVDHPAILDAAVVAVHADETEDEILAIVESVPDAEIDPAGLIDFLTPRMPHFMVPRYIEIVPELPRTPTGKVRKVELRERGIGPDTWDRVAAGIEVKGTRLRPLEPTAGDGT